VSAGRVIRVLHIARYRSAAAERKLELLAAERDLKLFLVRPAVWEDEYGRVQLRPQVPGCQVLTVPMVGRPADPHRALYRTLTFGIPAAKPDVIHAEEEPDSLAALQVALARNVFAPRARLVLHTWQNVNRPKRPHVRAVLRLAFGQAQAVLCATDEALRVLQELGYRGPAAVILPTGVDTRLFRPASRPLPEGSFTVGYAGRLAPEKGVDTLLEALSRLPAGVRLRVVGDGPARPQLRELADRFGVGNRVEWGPPLPADRMVEAFAGFDVLVLPSRTTRVWKEQFGRVLVEAMACKVPVVGSDSGAIPEVVGDAGLVFPEGDAEALAACLRRLIESPGLRRELAERGYARAVALYSQERVAAQTAAFYRHLLDL
jgi:glycosyltransferase involved in cell wall biosynthesis